jgi:hypothetical protein
MLRTTSDQTGDAVLQLLHVGLTHCLHMTDAFSPIVELKHGEPAELIVDH